MGTAAQATLPSASARLGAGVTEAEVAAAKQLIHLSIWPAEDGITQRSICSSWASSSSPSPSPFPSTGMESLGSAEEIEEGGTGPRIPRQRRRRIADLYGATLPVGEGRVVKGYRYRQKAMS